MKCVLTKEQHLQFFEEIASSLLAKSKPNIDGKVEPFDTEAYIKDMYKVILDATTDVDLSLAYISVMPKYLAVAAGIGVDDLGDFLGDSFSKFNQLKKSFEADIQNVIDYVAEPALDQEALDKQMGDKPTTGTNIPKINNIDLQNALEDNNSAIAASITTSTGNDSEVVDNVNTNVINPNKKTAMLVQSNLISQMNRDAVLGSDLVYSSHRGFKLRLVNETQLPANSIEPGLIAQAEHLVLAIVDNDGNFLTFNDAGRIDPNGVVIYRAYRVPNSPETLERHATRVNQTLARLKNALESKKISPETIAITLEQEKQTLEQIRDAEIEMSLQFREAYKNSPEEKHLSEITGGSVGYVPTPTRDSKTPWAPMSKINVTDDEIGTITYTESGGSSIQFDGISKRITINGYPLDNEVFNNHIDNIARVLTSPKVSNEDKIEYLKTFVLTTDNKLDKIPTKILTDSKTGNLILEIRGNTIPNLNAASPLKVVELLLTNGLWFNIDAGRVTAIDYQDIQVSPSGEVTKKLGSYRDLIRNFTKVNTIPNTQGDVVELNGYFNWEYTAQQAEKEAIVADKTISDDVLQNISESRRWKGKHAGISTPEKLKERAISDVKEYKEFIATLNSDKAKGEEMLKARNGQLLDDFQKIYDILTGKTIPEKPTTKDSLEYWEDQEGDLTAHKLIELATTSEQQKAADKWWAQSPLSKAKDSNGDLLIPLERLRNIVNSNAFATWSLAGIKLNAGSDDTHLYHEAWHAFSQLYLTKAEKIKLYAETAKMKGTFKVVVRAIDENGKIVPMLKDVEFGNATKRQLEEYIAEAFREYAINKGTKATPVKAMKSIFQKIIDLLKALFTGVTIQDTANDPKLIKPLADMFNALYVGDINNYAPLVSNVMFSIANAGIISTSNLEDELNAQETKMINDSIDGLLSETLEEKAKLNSNWTVSGLTRDKNKIILYNIVKAKIYKRYIQLLNIKKNSKLEEANKLTEDEIKKIDNNPEYLKGEIVPHPNDNLDDMHILDRNIRLLEWAYLNFGNVENSITNSNKKDKEPGVVSYNLLNSAFKSVLSVSKGDDVIVDEVITEEDPEKGKMAEDEQVIAAKKKSEYGDHGPNSNNSFDDAGDDVIYLIKSLLKQDELGKNQLNTFGFPTLVNYNNVKNNLERKLTGHPVPSILYDVMVKLASTDDGNIYQQLLSRMGVPGTGNSQQDDLWLSWTRTLSKPKQVLITNNIEVTRGESITNGLTTIAGPVKILYKTGRASSDYHRVKTGWQSEFKQRVSKTDPYVLLNNDNANYLNLEAIVKDFLVEKVGKVNITYELKPGNDNVLKFLNAIGLNVTSSNVTLKEITGDKGMMTDIGFLVNAIGYLNNQSVILQEDGQKPLQITNPIDYLSKDNKGLQKNKNGEYPQKNIFSQRALINNIAKIEANNSDQYSSTSRLTAEKEKQSEIAKQSSISKMVYALQKATNRNDFENKDSYYQYMSYLSRLNNPNSKASILLNSIFSNYNGTRRGTIDLVNLSGTSLLERKDGTLTENGLSHASMTMMDKFITDFNTALISGIMAHPTTGGKSTHYATKVDNIRTYDDKKQNYLYIDSFEFIADEEGNYTGSDKVLNIMLPYIQAELERMIMFNQNREVYDTYQGFSKEKMNSFSMFDDILTEDTKNKLKASGIMSELEKGVYRYNSTEEQKNVYEKNKGITLKSILLGTPLLTTVNKEITAYFNKLTAQHQSTLVDKYGYVSEQVRSSIVDNMKGIKLDPKNVDDLKKIDDAALRSFTLNTWINNAEIIMLYNGGLTSYNHEKDEATKRFPLVQSSGDMFPTDIVSQNIINKLGTALTKQVTGQDAKFDGTLTTSVIKDKEVRREHVYSKLNDLFKKYFEDKGLTGNALTEALYGKDKEKGLGTFKKPFGGAMKAYAKPTTTDGQGYITLDSYRWLKKLESKWSPEQEDLYQKIVAKAPLNLEDISKYFPVYKLQYAGSLKTEPGLLPVMSGHKFALMPLIPGLGFYALDELHDTMMKNGVHYVTHSSGSKLQSITGNTDTEGDRGDTIFDEKTGSIIKDSKLTKNVIYADYLKNQTDVNDEFKGKATMSTQLRTLLSTGLIENGLPIDFTAKNKGLSDVALAAKWEAMSEEEQMADSKFFNYVRSYEKRVTHLVEQKKDDLLSKLAGWRKNDKGRYEGPQSSIIEYILKELKAQGLTDQELSFISYDGHGNLLRDLSGSPIADVLEKKLMALINNKIIKQMVTGEPLVEVTAVNTTNLKFKGKGKDVDAARAKYGDNGLLAFYGPDVDGEKNTTACQVKIAIQGSFMNLFKLNDNEGNKIGHYEEVNGKQVLNLQKSLDKLNSLITNEEWLANDDNRKKIRLTGVRIPVQGLNSMEYAEVAEFLPPSAGNIIILPEEIVAKSGTDFDVDKLTTYMPTIGKDGSWLYDKYANRNELQGKIDKVEEKLQALLKAKVGEKETTKELIKEYRTGKKDKGLTIVALKLNRDLLVKEMSIDIAEIKAFIKNEHYENKINAGLKRLMETEDDAVAIGIVNGFINKPTLLSGGKTSIAFDNILAKSAELKDIKTALKESYEDKTDYLKESPEINTLYNEYSNLMDYQRNFIKSIENSLINDIISILELPENSVRLLTANDTHKTKPLADEMENYVKDVDFKSSLREGVAPLKKGISPTRLLEYGFNLKKHEDNFVSKEALGIAALGNKGNSVYNSAGAFIPNEVSFKTKIKGKKAFVPVTTKLYLKTNKIMTMENGVEKEVISLSNLYSKDGNEISEIISQLMNGYVDAEKDAWIAYIQGNKEVTPIILFLLETGVPFEDIVYFVSNPLIREYVQNVKTRKGLLAGLKIDGNDPKNAKKEAKKDMWKKLKAAKSVKSSTVLDMVQIANALDTKYGNTEFSTETLRTVAKSKIEDGIKNQDAVAGFMHYLYVEELARNFDEPRSKTNLDTNRSSTLFDVHKKQALIDELYQSTKMPLKIIKYIVEIGPTSAFRITELAQDLFGSLFSVRNSDEVNEYLFSMIKDFAVTEKIQNDTGIHKDVFPVRYKNALTNFLFVNNLKSFVMGKSTFYKAMPIKYINTGTQAVTIRKVDGIDVMHINENQIQKDFKNKNFTKEAEGPTSYRAQKLAPLSANAFYKNAGYESKMLGAKSYFTFVAEREFMRSNTPFEKYVETDQFKVRFDKLTSGEKPLFSNHEVAANVVYEEYLRNIALENAFNFNTMFFDNQDYGISSYATNLMRLIKSYPNLATKYSILEQISASHYYDEYDTKTGANVYLKDLVNITLRDSNDLTPETITQYAEDLAKLADSNVVKIQGNTLKIKEDNERLSVLFRMFPTYISLQGGMNKNQFAFPSIFPVDSSQSDIMNSAINNVDITPELLDTVFNLFLRNNKVNNKKVNERIVGPSYELASAVNELRDVTKDIEKKSIISWKAEFDRLTNTSIPGIYTVDTKDITPEEMSDLAITYSGEALFITEGDTFDSSNFKMKLDSIANIDDSISEMVLALGSGTALIFDDNGYGRNIDKSLQAHLTKELFDKLGVTNRPGAAEMIQGTRIINNDDVASFRAYVAKSKKQPDEFFTSSTTFKEFYNPETGKREKAPQSSIWMLNDGGLYDLVNLEEGDIFISNVDLNTGYQMVLKPVVKPIVKGPITLDKATVLSSFIGNAGAAKGADTVWDNEGKPFGVTYRHYTVATYDNSDGQTKAVINNWYLDAVKFLGRGIISADTYSGKLVRRDMLQANAGSAIFAVTELIKPGIKGRKGYNNKMSYSIPEGGTGYAVARGIISQKPVYVFNQSDTYGNDIGWYVWDSSKNDFVKTETIPVLTKNFTGIGTQEINEAGKQAIRDVYQKTFDTLADNTFNC